MTHINLLPWREKKREHEKKKFTVLLVFCTFSAVLIVIFVNYYVCHLVNHQTKRNQILDKEIFILDTKIKKIKLLKHTRQTLINRMIVVQNLQSKRTLMVHLFDELIKVTPIGLYVTKLEKNNDIVLLSGRSESNTNVSLLMRNIENSKWLHNPILTEIKKMDDETLVTNEFILTFVLKPKSNG